VRITASEGTMLADPRRLGQAVSNLLSNAIKYSPPGSEVTLSAAPQGSRVRLSVQDEGPGIPAAERSRLFRPFGKTSVRPTGGESSTGLGLWIVRQLVTLQDGCAGTEFPPDGGAIFWLELPASAAASPVPASRAARCG
jgi:signal transduction histidine kinase